VHGRQRLFAPLRPAPGLRQPAFGDKVRAPYLILLMLLMHVSVLVGRPLD
jgi:hypothetical protein